MIQHSTIKYGHLLVGHSLSFDGQDKLVNKCQLHNFTLSNLIRTKPMYEQEFKANYITYITNKMQTKRSPFPLFWHRLKPCEPSANLAPLPESNVPCPVTRRSELCLELWIAIRPNSCLVSVVLLWIVICIYNYILGNVYILYVHYIL